MNNNKAAKIFVPPLIWLSLQHLMVRSQTCNETQYFAFEDTEHNTTNATKSTNRCLSVKCLYDDECESKYCLKLDTTERVDLEGYCSRPNLKNTCHTSIVDKTGSSVLTLGRCEWVPCIYDNECSEGMYC
jgi:hypothetical protein